MAAGKSEEKKHNNKHTKISVRVGSLSRGLHAGGQAPLGGVKAVTAAVTGVCGLDAVGVATGDHVSSLSH